LKQKIKHPILTPVFFLAIPVVFYAALYPLGVSTDEARDSGWLFSFATPGGGGRGGGGAGGGTGGVTSVGNNSSNSTRVNRDGGGLEGGMGGGAEATAGVGRMSMSSLGVIDECRSFPGVLACLDVRLIAWDVVPSQLFTFLGLVFFRWGGKEGGREGEREGLVASCTHIGLLPPFLSSSLRPSLL